jgi:hypothetical protein
VNEGRIKALTGSYPGDRTVFVPGVFYFRANAAHKQVYQPISNFPTTGKQGRPTFLAATLLAGSSKFRADADQAHHSHTTCQR